MNKNLKYRLFCLINKTTIDWVPGTKDSSPKIRHMNKNILRKLNKIALCALVSSSLFAEEASVEEQFLVTATKSETEAREIGKSFTVITRQEIEDSNHNNLLDMLRRVPGLNIASNGPHGSTRIFIRGNESYYTKVLINGVAVDDASSTQVHYANVINSIGLDNVERIEIIRGAQSTLYGSDAIGGVINIITRKGDGETISGSIRQEFGEDEFSKSTINLRGSEGAFNYSLSLSHEFQDAISTTNSDSSNYESDGDDYRNTSGNLTLSYLINESLEVGLTGSYLDSNVEFDSPWTPGSENYIQNSTVRPHIKLYDLMDDKLEVEIAYNHTDNRRTTTSGYNSYSEVHKYELLNTFDLADWNTLIIGGDFIEQQADFDSPTGSGAAYKVRYNEYYAQEQLRFEDKYFLTFGGRYSDHSDFGEEWTYQIAPAIYFEETGTKLHASYGTGYRAPSPYELFDVWSGDDSLTPETSESFDIGFDQTFEESGLSFGATYFYVETEDKIIYSFSSSKYDQIGNARSYGVESYVQYDFSKDLFAKLTYTRTHTEDNRETGDQRSPRVPKDSATILANWQATNKLNFDAEVNIGGNRYSDRNNTDTLGSYTTVGLAATYDIDESFTVFARVNNLFDEDYEEVKGYNTYGRSFFGGLEYKF
ncbi:MAG: TonB-dependent receptor [Lentisphaerales bacterium]|nr:TonB-dependent receptor [Lentisphaerales bacterium]